MFGHGYLRQLAIYKWLVSKQFRSFTKSKKIKLKKIYSKCCNYRISNKDLKFCPKCKENI